MNIKKVSELTGVSADTICYYERIGLIPHIHRSQSGIRHFTDNDIAVLEFVRCFRQAGVSGESLIDYMGLVQEGDHNIEARISILQEELGNMNDRLEELTMARDRLIYKIDNYRKKIVPHEQELFDSKEG